MQITFEYWFMLPIAMAVATIAMASGIGGAVFFSPIFLLWLKLEPTIAIGTALLTELFGFTSGLVAYVRAKRIDFKLARGLLVFSIPAATVGVLIADVFPSVVLKSIFATGLLFIGMQLYTSWRQEQREKQEESIAQEAEQSYESELRDKNGTVYRYTVCNKNQGRVFAAVGGAFLGMISVGLAELQEYHLVAKCRVPSQVAVATSIFVVVVTVLVAVIGHGYQFVTSAEPALLSNVVSVAMFTIPGVLIGGQIGPRVGARLNPDVLKVAIAVLFIGVGGFMLTTLAI
ncbi:MAG: sulfite exporter TauE/SafE family protein [Proteobacteria bacterium]|nr:sulfite exporter TauE/SafE family protein [Pseudomonadota bacterium]